jgi:hypothetical protein
MGRPRTGPPTPNLLTYESIPTETPDDDIYLGVWDNCTLTVRVGRETVFLTKEQANHLSNRLQSLKSWLG